MALDYDAFITILAAWISIMLWFSVARMISRRDKGARDYGVILFVASVSFVFTMIWFRRFLEWPPQVVVPTFAVLAVSSTGLAVWIEMSIRDQGRRS